MALLVSAWPRRLAALAILILADPGLAASLVDVRLAAHSDYDRIVLELSDEVSANLLFAPAEGTGSLVLDVEAEPRAYARALSFDGRRLGPVAIQRTEHGSRLIAEARSPRIRAFRLEAPPRLVIDFGDPAPGPFPIPADGLALVGPDGEGTRPTLRPGPPPQPSRPAADVPRAATPTPTADPGVAERGRRIAAGDAPARVRVARAEAPPAAARADREVSPTATGQARDPFVSPAGVRPRVAEGRNVDALPASDPGLDAGAGAAPDSPVGPEPHSEVALVEPASGSEGPTGPAEPDDFGSSSSAGSPSGLLGPWLMLGVFGISVGGLLLFAWMRRSSASAVDEKLGVEREDPHVLERLGEDSPDVITPSELQDPAARAEALEKRLDQEVRARLHLEAKLGELQAEYKVLRDRMRRLAPRSVDAS